MQNKTKLKRAYLITSLVIWVLLVFTSYQTAPDLELEQSLYFESSPDFLNNLLLTSFLLLSFLYYKSKISSDDELNINKQFGAHLLPLASCLLASLLPDNLLTFPKI